MMNTSPPAATSVLVASPIYNDQCYGSYTHSLLQLQAALYQRSIGFEYAWTKSSSLITIARNLLVDWLLNRTQCTHILFVDADMVFRAEDVLKLVDADKDVIGAICPRKEINWANVVDAARAHPNMPAAAFEQAAGSYGTFKLLEPEQGISVVEPVPVRGIGTGIMLVKRDVFVKMAAAYPDAVTWKPGHAGVDRMATLFDLEQDEQGVMLSEDLTFCKRWRAIGGEVYGAPWFEVGHIGSYEFRGSLASIAAVNGIVSA